MRRLLRILSNVAAVLSLLACLAACVFWARSYWSLDGYMSDTTELRGHLGGYSCGVLPASPTSSPSKLCQSFRASNCSSKWQKRLAASSLARKRLDSSGQIHPHGFTAITTHS